MRRLFLVRHAKSDWDDSLARDHERELANRGKRDAPIVAERLSQHINGPDLIISSHARRAHETARIFAGVFAYADRDIRIDRRLYLAGASSITSVAAEQSDRYETMMLFGHNPDFTVLANTLATDLQLDNMPTSAVVGIEFESKHWHDIESIEGRLIYFDYPKNKEQPIIR